MHYILGSELDKNEKLTGKRNSRRVKPKLIFFFLSLDRWMLTAPCVRLVGWGMRNACVWMLSRPQLKVIGFPPPQRRREKRDPIAVNSFLENHSNAGKKTCTTSQRCDRVKAPSVTGTLFRALNGQVSEEKAGRGCVQCSPTLLCKDSY